MRSLVRMGVTREQLNEMLAVSVYMGGGPSLMYAAEVLQAFEEFQQAITGRGRRLGTRRDRFRSSPGTRRGKDESHI